MNSRDDCRCFCEPHKCHEKQPVIALTSNRIARPLIDRRTDSLSAAREPVRGWTGRPTVLPASQPASLAAFFFTLLRRRRAEQAQQLSIYNAATLSLLLDRTEKAVLGSRARNLSGSLRCVPAAMAIYSDFTQGAGTQTNYRSSRFRWLLFAIQRSTNHLSFRRMMGRNI